MKDVRLLLVHTTGLILNELLVAGVVAIPVLINLEKQKLLCMASIQISISTFALLLLLQSDTIAKQSWTLL